MQKGDFLLLINLDHLENKDYWLGRFSGLLDYIGHKEKSERGETPLYITIKDTMRDYYEEVMKTNDV